jgi:hypothetical protein
MKTEAVRTIASFRVPEPLYQWIETEQARLSADGVHLPITSVVRMVLQRAQKEQAEPEPKRKAK